MQVFRLKSQAERLSDDHRMKMFVLSVGNILLLNKDGEVTASAPLQPLNTTQVFINTHTLHHHCQHGRQLSAGGETVARRNRSYRLPCVIKT